MKRKSIYLLIMMLFLLTSCFNNVENTVDDTVVTNTGANVLVNNVKQSYDKIKDINKYDLEKNIGSDDMGANLKSKIEKLETLKEIPQKDKLKIIDGFLGNYDKVIKAKENHCKIYLRDVDCKKFKSTFSFKKIKSDTNKILKDDIFIEFDGKKVEFSNRVILDVNYDMNHLFKVYKKGYIGYYYNFHSGLVQPKSMFQIEPVLYEAQSKKIIISHKKSIHKTKNYKFIVDPNSFSYSDGTKVLGEIELYIFDIEKNNGSIFGLNTFDSKSLSFIGKGFNDHGVALIKAYKGDKVLKIKKNVKVLSNFKKMGLLIKSNDLKNVIKNKILTREEINKNDLPFIGNLDFDAGVWLSSDFKIRNNSGDIEFYLK